METHVWGEHPIDRVALSAQTGPHGPATGFSQTLDDHGTKKRDVPLKTKQLLLVALALTLPLAGTNAQVWTTNTLPSDLIAWWQAEGNMLDSAGVHHGSGSAALTYAPGRFGQAFQFNGSDQSVSIPDVHADLDSWTQFTLEAWVNFDNTADAPGGGQAVFSKVGTPGHLHEDNFGYQFGLLQGASRLFCLFNSSGQPWPGFVTSADLGGPAPTNTWLHVAATYDHNAVKLYFNGVPLVTNVIGPVTIANYTLEPPAQQG